MYEALTAEESAIYGAFLSSSDMVVHHPEQKIGKFASALGLKTLADHSPEESAKAASRMARVFSAQHVNASVSASSEMPAGGIIFLAESNQEVMDSVVLAYRISEDPKVRMHASVVYEYPKFIETVQMPNISAIKSFLPKKSFGASSYSEKSCLAMITKAEEAWKKKFHRSFGLIECYKVEDAEKVVVMPGFHFPTCKAAVDSLRAKGSKVGAVRIRTLSPFPSEAVAKHLAGKSVSVLDNAAWGPVLAAKLHAKSSFQYSKYLSKADFFNIFANTGKEGIFEIKQ